MKKSFFIIIILVAIGCGSDAPPEEVMSETEMINYLIDLHIAEALVQNLRLDTDSAKVVFDVQQKFMLKKHNVSDTLVVISYNYYLEHPLVLEEIYSAVVDSISLRQSLLNEPKK